MEQSIGDKLYEAMSHVIENIVEILQRTVEQDLVEVDKTTAQKRISERSQVIEVPTISRQDVEVVKTTTAEAYFLNGGRLSKCPRPCIRRVPSSQKCPPGAKS